MKVVHYLRMGLLFFAAALAASSLRAQSSPPSIFYTDLTSGPNTGGESNRGTIVTISGKNFGATQGSSTVTVGGGAVAYVYSWSDTKVAVGIGAAAATGNIVVTTAAGASNGTPFTVRSGSIFFVSGSGSDSNAGTFTSPWKTLLNARANVKAGSIVYAMTGSDQTVNDGSGWHAAMVVSTDLMANGTASNPIAFAVYPGNTVHIGSTSASDLTYGIRTKANGLTYVTFSGFTITDAGPGGAIEISGSNDSNLTFVNNDISCPLSNAPDGCVFTNGAYTYLYGNNIHDSGKSLSHGSTSKLFHQIYLSGSPHMWIGWNTVHDDYDCRGILTHNSGGTNMYDIHIFNNVVYNDPCDGITIGTIDPSQGTVEIYNNLVYHVGTGPDPGDGAANYSCVYNTQEVDAGSNGSGNILVYNNTFYDCGSHSTYSGDNGALNSYGSLPGLILQATNNIFYMLPGELYATASGGSGYGDQIQGSNNVWYGLGNGPTTGFTNNINANPLVTSVSTPDFHLQTGSPAIGAGSTSHVPARDYDGNPRPSPPSIGAYELAGSGSVVSQAPKPASPTNLTVVVQ